MKPLPFTFKSRGFNFTQLKRVGLVALYEKTMPEIRSPSYEVVIVQRHAERMIAGAVVPAAEAMPGAEQWGQKGWTCTSQKQAILKFEEVCRNNPKAAAEEAPLVEVSLADLAEADA